MPIHDWTRVNAGLFHHFHQTWIAYLCRGLNAGTLPSGYFALIGPPTAGLNPDVLNLQLKPGSADRARPGQNGGVAVAVRPPRTRFVHQAEEDVYVRKANRIAIHHPLGDVVAIIEIVSPGNKSSRTALRSFVEKAAGFLRQGIHLLIIDLFPPSSRDPQGIHKAIWDEIKEEPFALPPDKPLTLAAYSAGFLKTAYVEPVAVGDVLPSNLPLFLDPDTYVIAPLEDAYQTTWNACPAPLQDAVMTGLPAPESDRS
jgi:hypothetical protein